MITLRYNVSISHSVSDSLTRWCKLSAKYMIVYTVRYVVRYVACTCCRHHLKECRKSRLFPGYDIWTSSPAVAR